MRAVQTRSNALSYLIDGGDVGGGGGGGGGDGGGALLCARLQQLVRVAREGVAPCLLGFGLGLGLGLRLGL